VFVQERCVTSGGARPAVLLHGCGGSFASTFEATGWLDALRAAGRRSVKIHLPGHGVIPAPHDPAHYEDLAGLVAKELPAVPFDGIGFSLGAKLLLELALRIPERLSRLVLGGVGDNVFAPESIAEQAARALESGPAADTPAPVLAFLRTWEPHRNDALAVAAVLRRPPNPVFTPDRLARIAQPVLVVNGDEDPVGRNASRLLSSLVRVEHHRLPGIGHFDLPAQPAFIQLAIDFLQDAER
jgi:pimeloyl-ACP methyl ester carboxylesterase